MQSSPYWEPKSKIFLGRGHSPLPSPLPRWGGDTLPTPHPLGASILAPVALDLGACGASSSNFAKTVWMSAMRAATVDPIGLKAN